MPISQINKAFLSFDWVNDEQCDPIYLAAVESVEEAVVNALLAADDMTTLRPAGHVCRAIDHDRLVDLLRQHGRCT
jgi:D-aminopeptidase